MRTLLGDLLSICWLHGYAVIVIERPGTEAAFGVMDPSFEVGADQADEILDWIRCWWRNCITTWPNWRLFTVC
jgi:hypothetical protein